MKKVAKIIGAGLAGCEAAWQLAKRGNDVLLCEMRPHTQTPAHQTGLFAELVCSNSLRGASLANAVGLLKYEMRQLDSLIMQAADKCKVPAGGALAVDRVKFSEYITETLEALPNVEVVREEVEKVDPDELTIIAAGPLCSTSLAASLAEMLSEDYLYFYDAAAPIVTYDSIDFDESFTASRYGKGGDDYINCPMNETEYNAFYQALIAAQVQPLRNFESEIFFEGCMPIEEMARRGKETMLYGPLKPVGLKNPKTGKQPYAVVQLRQDNLEGTLYNLVGFQTHLKWPEQKRVFQMIPGLANADFVRYGVMHRNTFINAPQVLLPTGQLKNYPNTFVAGQLSGVEGYVESAASGLICGVNASLESPQLFPVETAHGALMHYITSTPKKSFQPMNITFGLLPPLQERIRKKKLRKEAISQRALGALDSFVNDLK